MFYTPAAKIFVSFFVYLNDRMSNFLSFFYQSAVLWIYVSGMNKHHRAKN